jgi:hypothetical protein
MVSTRGFAGMALVCSVVCIVGRTPPSARDPLVANLRSPGAGTDVRKWYRFLKEAQA